MRNRPKFQIVGTSQRWKVRRTPEGQLVHYRNCLVQYPDGRRAPLYVRDELVAGAA